MIAQVTLVILAGGLLAQQTDWLAEGNRALDRGSPEEAAADFTQALDAQIRAGTPVKDLLHLQVTLATAYLEAGEYRETEATLQEALKTIWQTPDDLSRAELLNAWSALHLKLSQLSTAETELNEARRIVMKLADPGDLLPAVLHNLAGVEMRTGQYAEALNHEQEALRRLDKMLAPDHPMLIRGWASLASLQYMMGHPQDARISLDRALRSAEKIYGAAHPLLADLLESDAIILDKLKLKSSARQARDRARKIRRTAASAGLDPMIRSIREPPVDGQVHLRTQ
jgi:tetratricopeptide (TPR) repeat protein